MMHRPPRVTSLIWPSWRLVLAGLATVLVAAVAIGVGALSTPGAPTPPATSPVPGMALQASGTPTPTPRVITVPNTTSPPATAPITQEPDSTVTATPTPWLLIADAPTATPLPPATIAPSSTPAPAPSPTPIPPSPTVAPVDTPVPAVQLAFAAEDWAGGFYRGDGQAYGRPWTAVYGAASAYPRAALSFSLDAAPREPAAVSIAGLDDEWPARNEIALEVNGLVVFSGPSPFADWDGVGNGADAAWTTVQFRIPASSLRAGTNEIAVANLTPASNFNAPPYVLVSDVTLDLSTDGSAVPQPIAEPDDAGKKEKSRALGNDNDKKQKSQKSKPAKDNGAKKGHKKSKRQG